MLSAARRSLLPGGSSIAAHLDLRLAALSLHHSSPFSTSAPPNEAPRIRLSKVKRAERADKLEKKRVVRGLRRDREENRREMQRMAEHRRVEEVRDKRDIGEDISDSLAPFTEDQLQAMYTGLLAATPSELSSPLLAAPQAAPALPDPARDSLERQGRLSLLEQRLIEIEGEMEEMAEAEGVEESLAERLRARRGAMEEKEKEEQEVERVEGEASVPAVSSGPARALLDRLEALLPEGALEERPTPGAGETALALPRGLLSRGEWEGLVLACAEEGDREGVFKALLLMDRSTPISEGKLLEKTLALYSSEERTQDALALVSFARQNSLPLSVLAHHHLLTALAPSHPELALRHLQSMEAAGHTPLLATYTSVIRRLLSPLSPPHLVRTGWDLYAHTRAVAYPVPDPSLFSTMIRACATGAHPAPERAVDLFTEMTDDNRLPATEAAFNGVIRACSREGSQEYYYEALRYMRRMLDENVEPSRHTFHALLEGAKRHGDLARARWMLVKMVTVGGEAEPTEKTLSLVLQTYAAFKPDSRVRNEGGAAVAKEASGEAAQVEEDGTPAGRGRLSSTLEPSQDPTRLPSSASPAGTSSSTQAVIELLGEASIFYPGPMPTTSAEVVAEARNLMLQVVDASVLAPSPSTAAPSSDASSTSPPPHSPPQPSMFPSVEPTTFLLNSYLSVLNSHAPLPSSLSFFSTAYAALSLPKNRFSYELVMRRLELANNKDGAVKAATGVFEEWLRWREAPFAGARSAEGEQEGAEAEATLDRKEMERWARDRRDGRNASKIWGGLIRVLSRNFAETEALAVLKRFHELHPPSAVAAGVRLPSLPPAPTAPVAASSPLPALPIKLSSPLYPETAPSLDALRPPFLTFDDLKLLHLRLANMENREGIDFVTWVARRYEKAVRTARRREAKREERRK
ncbi:hypothetical protein JCM6882_006600 [Rhodosporidiobolus microsporus]